MKRTTEKILITGLILVVCAIISILFLSYKQSQKVHDTDALITHTSDILYQSERILSDVIDNETSTRGFALTGDEKYLDPLQKSENTVYQEIAILKKLTGNNPDQQVRIDSLTKYVTKRLTYSRNNIDIRRTKGLASVMKLMETGEGKFYTDQVRIISSNIQQEENKLLEQRREANRHAITHFNNILSSLAIMIFLLVVIVSITILKSFLLHKKTQQFLLQSNFALDKDVKEKTAQLAHIFERINDGFAAVDSNWYFTYVNKKAGEILNYLPEQLLGKNIWDIFPDSETSNKPFFDAFHTAMQKQEVIYLEEYYPPFERWPAMHIYPSKDGISVIFSDITGKKKAEKKY
jgi:PAS domain S-box-containing protein